MGIYYAPETPYAKELAKWEFDDYRNGDLRGLRGPRVYQEFPKRLYKAGRNGQNQIAILASEEAGDADHERLLNGRGFVFGPDKAIEAWEAQEREFARLAANRAHQERTMSDRARAEAAAVDDATVEHVPAIPETPIKRRGRPRREETHA